MTGCWPSTAGKCRNGPGGDLRSLTCPAALLSERLAGRAWASFEYWPVVSMAGPAWHLYPGYVSEVRGADFRVDHLWHEDR